MLIKLRKVKKGIYMRNYNSKTSAVHDTDPDTTAFKAGWPAWLGLLGSFWIIMSPFTLVYFDSIPALANDLIVGSIAFVLSAYCAYMANRDHDKMPRLVAGWLLVGCGAWLILAPFILNFTSVARALSNDLITGVLFIIVALYGLLFHTRRYDKAIKSDPV